MVRTVFFGGAGCDHQADGCRAAALWPAMFCLLCRGADRVRLVDAVGARLETAFTRV